MHMALPRVFTIVSLLTLGCTGSGTEGANPFLQDQSKAGKDDSGYLNPGGIEVEVDLEADAVTDPAAIFAAGPDPDIVDASAHGHRCRDFAGHR